MIVGYIHGQKLEVLQPKIVADTIDYLEAQFYFKSSEWDDCEKWAHFRNGDNNYSIKLNNGKVAKKDHLNLGAGVWEIWLHGSEFVDGALSERITTNIVTITVETTGTIEGDPLPLTPEGEAERILAMIGNLSDLSTEEKQTLVAAINEAASKGGGGAVSSVNGQTGDVELTADDVGAISKDTYKNEYYYGDTNIEPSPIEEFTYEEDDNTVYLTGLTQEAAYDEILSVVIPYEAFGKKVALRQYDFESISSYTETLILPRGLQMGGYNFGYGSYIKKLVLPEGVDAIKSKCFRDLYNLSEVRIPEGVIAIQDGAFTGCAGLKRIYIPDSVISFNDSVEADAPFKGAEASATIVCSQGSAAEAYAKKRGFAIEYTGIAIDEKPTEGSKNAVSSGGVYEAIGDIETALDSIISLQEALIGGDSV